MTKETLQLCGAGFLGLALIAAIIGWVPIIGASIGVKSLVQEWMMFSYFSAWPLAGIAALFFSFSQRAESEYEDDEDDYDYEDEEN